jgi:hypothetical protein
MPSSHLRIKLDTRATIFAKGAPGQSIMAILQGRVRIIIAGMCGGHCSRAATGVRAAAGRATIAGNMRSAATATPQLLGGNRG